MFNNIFKSAPATFITLTSLALIAISAATVHNSVKTLNAATAKQCMMNDWPAADHDIHVEWCLDNGYQVN